MRIPLLQKKKEGPELVDMILHHTTKGVDRPGIVTRVKLPITEARDAMGARGFYVNYTLNWPTIMGIVIAILFGIQTTGLSLIGGASLIGSWFPILLSIVIGFVFGRLMGGMTRKFILAYHPEKSYHAWAEYDPETKQNTITPMEYELASSLAMNKEEQQRYLQARGMAQAKERTGHENGADPGPHMVGIVPVFTSKGFFKALHAPTAKLILTRPAKGEKFIQGASLAGIALAFVAIAVLLGMTVMKDNADAPKEPTSISLTPGPNQGSSNVRK